MEKELDNVKMWESLIKGCDESISVPLCKLGIFIKKALKEQGLVYVDDKMAIIKPEPLLIETGKWYMCIEQIYSVAGFVRFEKGKLYQSTSDGYIDHVCVGNNTFFRPATEEEIAKAHPEFNAPAIDNYDKIKQAEPRQEWSEEDVRRFNKIEIAICQNPTCNEEDIAFLKSISPQKQQEWSKEDIDMIDWLIRCCEKEHEELCNDRYGHQDIVSDLKRDCRKKWDWLESLKDKVVPQKHWKPSESQMKALANALSLAKSCGEESAFDLRTLYEQLKAL